MRSLGEILSLCKDYLAKQNIDSPRREAEDLLSDFLGCSRTELYMQYDRPLTQEELSGCRERLVRRGRGEPLVYIHGSTHFSGCELLVTPDVLIPRQESELLIDMIVRTEKQMQRPLTSIADVATGSGCLGLSLKRAFPEAQVTLTDLSPSALKVAKANAEKNNLTVEILEGDLLEPLQGRQFDLLVCNPPYISRVDYENLGKEVLYFEPKSALLAGTTGLEYYARLKCGLAGLMRPGGRVWFEIGHGQGDAILALFSDPIWTKQKTLLDWSQKERFFSLEKESNSLYPQ